MYSKILAKIIWVVEKILMVLLGAAVVIIAAQVFWRYCLSDPLSWTEQTARCLFVWMMMLSVPVLFYRRSAVAFDLIIDSVPRKVKDLLRIIIQLVILLFACFYLKSSIDLMIQTGDRILSGIEIPMNVMYIAPPIAMSILILVTLEQIYFCVKNFLKKEA